MRFLKRITRSNFYIKLTHWEYWPFGILQFPSMIYYVWLSIRSKSFLFFSASNPGIPMGGMFGESKYDILVKIPNALVPKTIVVDREASVNQVMEKLTRNGFAFPLIFKPDLGERGFMVNRIDNEQDIIKYL